MFNPIDMLQGQSAGMQGLAQQFGLTTDQTRRAMEALLPAFTIGLQRSAATDPVGFGQLFGLPAPAAKPPAAQVPELMLGQLFGSPLLAQAVIQQASAASGVGSQVVRQMLPLMAGMVVASIVHMMLNQGTQPQQPPPSAEPANPYLAVNTFWADMLRAFTSPQQAPAAPAAPPPPPSPPPLKAAPEPVKAPSKPAGKGGAEAQPMEMFNKMLQSGAEVQQQNVKAMQDIFDAFWADPKDKAGGKSTPAPEAAAAARAPVRTGLSKSPAPKPAAKSAAVKAAAKPAASEPAVPRSAPRAARRPGTPKPR